MQSLYGIMNVQDQHNIAQVFNVKIKILIPWLNSLNLLRNGAAHYGYLWNRNFTFPPKFPNRGLIPAFDDLLEFFELNQNNRLKLYCLLCIMAYMLERIDPNNCWLLDMYHHLSNFPTSPHIKISGMGVANNWQSQGFWRKIAQPCQ